MSQEERYGTRDLTYSAWHRRGSTARYVGMQNAQILSMIDMDAMLVEYDDKNRMPIAYIETAKDVGQPYKTATVTLNVAKLSNRPAFVLLYTPARTPNPANPQWPDIEKFMVKCLWPYPENQWRILTPDQWAKELLSMRSWVLDNVKKEDPKVTEERVLRWMIENPSEGMAFIMRAHAMLSQAKSKQKRKR